MSSCANERRRLSPSLGKEVQENEQPLCFTKRRATANILVHASARHPDDGRRLFSPRHRCVPFVRDTSSTARLTPSSAICHPLSLQHTRVPRSPPCLTTLAPFCHSTMGKRDRLQARLPEKSDLTGETVELAPGKRLSEDKPNKRVRFFLCVRECPCLTVVDAGQVDYETAATDFCSQGYQSPGSSPDEQLARVNATLKERGQSGSEGLVEGN